ncbi:MAG: hypothetical protein JKX78_12165 [Alteromonadaceae bacterium]|nr:hypothetical protein [Alteromonadaceae bacterium]
MSNTNTIPPLEIRLQVLSAVDHAPGNSIRARIQSVATRTFVDSRSDKSYQFTWRTISTWLYRFKNTVLPHSIIKPVVIKTPTVKFNPMN